MDFSQVKSLSIPNGSVVKITDSNGNVLYNKTVYRQLEYIYFSGTVGIDTLETPQQHFYFLDASIEGVANNH